VDVEAYDKNNFPKVLAESLLKMEQASGRGILLSTVMSKDSEKLLKPILKK